MASNVSYVQPQIPLLTGKNYDTWEIKMKTLFRSQGLTDIVEKGFEEPDDEFDLNDQQRRELQKNREKDGKAMMFIQIGMEELIFQRIRNVSLAKQA